MKQGARPLVLRSDAGSRRVSKEAPEDVVGSAPRHVLRDAGLALDDAYPGFDRRRRSAYMLERMTTHGRRRAAEMREVALTVADLGLDPAMSEASVPRQEALGGLGLRATKDDDTKFWPRSPPLRRRAFRPADGRARTKGNDFRIRQGGMK